MPVQAAAQSLATVYQARTFPAAPAQVPEARRFVASVMTGSSAADDALVCLSELVTNSVAHSRSGRGGSLTVQVTRTAQTWRISVGDEGGPWMDHRAGNELHNRGLAIVAALSVRWQIDGDGLTGRVVWFEVAER